MRGHNHVFLREPTVSNDHEFKTAGGDTSLTQSKELSDRIVFAVAIGKSQNFEGPNPGARRRPYQQIDRAVYVSD